MPAWFYVYKLFLTKKNIIHADSTTHRPNNLLKLSFHHNSCEYFWFSYNEKWNILFRNLTLLGDKQLKLFTNFNSFFRILYPCDNFGWSQGASSQIHSCHGKTYGDVQRQTSYHLDWSVCWYWGKILVPTMVTRVVQFF